MDVADETRMRYCSFCGREVREPVLYRSHIFCSHQCKESFVSSKERPRGFIELQSIRAFKHEAIPPNVLRRILEAGRHTPTAHNVQPWHFIVVSDPETKEQLSITGKFLQNAALILVGCGDPEDSPKWYWLEVGISLQSMVVAAWMQGIGSCWVDAGPNEERVKAILGIPRRFKVVALVALGYPAETPRPVWKKPLEEIIHYDKF